MVRNRKDQQQYHFNEERLVKQLLFWLDTFIWASNDHFVVLVVNVVFIVFIQVIIDPYHFQQDEYYKIMNDIKYVVENINLENL